MAYHHVRSSLWGMFSSTAIIPVALPLGDVGSEKRLTGVKFKRFLTQVTRLSFRLVI